MSPRTLVRRCAPRLGVLIVLGLTSTNPDWYLNAQERPAVQEPVEAADHPLDPSAIVRIALQGTDELLYDPLAPLSARTEIEGSGVIKIDFARDVMRRRWQRGTQAAINIRGQVLSSDSSTRAIEIPGYSEIGAASEPRTLNVRSAGVALNLMQQAAIFAGTILRFLDEAEHAALEARLEFLEEYGTAYDAFAAETNRILADVYEHAHSFVLIPVEIEEAAARLQAARKKLPDREGGLARTDSVRIDTFFSKLRTLANEITTWLGLVSSDENRAFLRVIGRLLGRSPDVLIASVADVANTLDRLASDELTHEAEARSIGHLAALAQGVARLEQDAYLRIVQLPESTRERLVNFRHTRVSLPEIMYETALAAVVHPATDVLARTNEVLVSDAAYTTACGPRPERRSDGGVSTGDSLARAFLRELGQRTGQDFSRRPTAVLAREFTKVLEERAAIAATVDGLAEAVWKRNCRQQVRASIVADRTPMYRASRTAVELVMLHTIMDNLIDAVPPTYVNLADLDLEFGDQLVFEVSTIATDAAAAVTTGYRPFVFDVVPRGLTGPFPRIADTQIFAKPREVRGDFSLRPGVLATWTYYGNSEAMRWIAPGFGFALVSLDFRDRRVNLDGTVEESNGDAVQFGFGIAVTLFNNLVTATYGRNLSAAATREREFSVEDDDQGNPIIQIDRKSNRWYFGIGFSVRGIADRF